MKKMYQITARLVWKEGEWSTSLGVPTFFLDPDIQGIVSEDHACRIAKGVIDAMCKAEKAVIDAVLVDVDSGFPVEEDHEASQGTGDGVSPLREQEQPRED